MRLLQKGQRFGRLVVVEEIARKGRNRCCRCDCDCGQTKELYASHLFNGSASSCGCYRRECLTKHGLSGTRIYYQWHDMLSRCESPKCKAFKDYGGRGIKVCERWHDINNFVLDMGMPPHPKLELDRIDNNRDYEPGNVRWTTEVIQARNQRKRSNTASHYRGVSWDAARHKWVVHIYAPKDGILVDLIVRAMPPAPMTRSQSFITDSL